MEIKLPTRRGKILKGPDEDAHYYTQDGQPRYDITDIRQARKLNLFPSPTTKLGMFTPPQLTNWKVLNGMDAVLLTKRRIPGIYAVGAKDASDLPNNVESPEFEIRVADETVAGPFPSYPAAIEGLMALRLKQPDLWESEENWGKRIGETYDELISKGSKFGSEFHEPLERMARGEPMGIMPEERIYPWLKYAEEWFRQNIVSVYAVEAVMVDFETRTAGKTDLIAEHRYHGLVILDWKTQDVKKRDRETGRPVPVFYDKWCGQLGRYRSSILANPPDTFPAGLDISTAKCMNVVFDSREPAEPVEHVWSEDDIRMENAKFVIASQYYELDRGYVPSVDENARATIAARHRALGAGRPRAVSSGRDFRVSSSRESSDMFVERDDPFAPRESTPVITPPSFTPAPVQAPVQHPSAPGGFDFRQRLKRSKDAAAPAAASAPGSSGMF